MTYKQFQKQLSKIHKSLTIWFNSLVLSFITAVPMLQEVLPQIQDYLHQDIYKLAATVLVVGNIILRFRTSKPLAEK